MAARKAKYMRYARDSQRVKLSRNDNLQAPTKYPSSAGRCLHFFHEEARFRDWEAATYRPG